MQCRIPDLVGLPDQATCLSLSGDSWLATWCAPSPSPLPPLIASRRRIPPSTKREVDTLPGTAGSPILLRGCLDGIDQEPERAAKIVRNLLTFARQEKELQIFVVRVKIRFPEPATFPSHRPRLRSCIHYGSDTPATAP